MMVTELLFTHDKLLSLNLGNNKIDHDGIIGILSVLNSSLKYTNLRMTMKNCDYPVNEEVIKRCRYKTKIK